MVKELAFATALTGILAGSALAADVVNLRTWKLDDEMRAGYSAENLIDTEVRGLDGKEIGEVENLIVGPDGKIRKLVIETGGFFDIGDKHLAVAWKDVTVGPGVEYVTVPLTEQNVERYGMFDGLPERVEKGPRAWRATELIGDFVRLKGGVNYGYVRDLIFTNAGELKAVIVSPDVAYGRYPGYYAYPFHGYGYGYGWDPGLDYYDLPYERGDIAELEPVDLGG